VAPEALEELDFSGLRGMVIGAERIDARVLDDFARLLAPNGLDRRALLPAYGLAEATLAVTGLPVDEGWSSARLDPSSLVMDERIASLGNGGTVEAVQGGVDESAGGTVVVGCGRPLAGVVIAIASENGASLPELHVGEIVVRGASLADGYVGDAETTLTRLTEGTLWTGDAGFLLDGQLYVLGRLGDSMKVRGRVVFSEDLEVGLAAAGAPRQRIAVLLGVHAGNPTVVLLVEDTEPSWRSAAEALLHQRTDGAVALIITVPRGTIARTSSGKPRRRYLWQAFVAGECTQPIPPRMPSEAAIPGPPPAPGQIAGDAGASAVTPMTTHRYSND
jgi:acyl-CoA synthetase (AMP-forming)/AMP-acid ligase II